METNSKIAVAASVFNLISMCLQNGYKRHILINKNINWMTQSIKEERKENERRLNQIFNIMVQK